jgi:hypothetical protein
MVGLAFVATFLQPAIDAHNLVSYADMTDASIMLTTADTMVTDSVSLIVSTLLWILLMISIKISS